MLRFVKPFEFDSENDGRKWYLHKQVTDMEITCFQIILNGLSNEQVDEVLVRSKNRRALIIR